MRRGWLVQGTIGDVADVTEGNNLLHGQERNVFANARHPGADKCLSALSLNDGPYRATLIPLRRVLSRRQLF